MTENQGMPRYEKIVAAVPHSVGEPACWQWTEDVGVVTAKNRWTDWFTDKLFDIRISGVQVVKGRLSRFDCDLERLEHEPDRLCRFAIETESANVHDRIIKEGHLRNGLLAEWFRYRAEILAAASHGFSLIADCHSFPCDLAPDVDICIGFNEDASKPDDRTLDFVADTFRKIGYSVQFNHPYANAIAPIGFVGHSLMIEVNKRTYMDERTLAKNVCFNRLKATIRRAFRGLLSTRDRA